MTIAALKDRFHFGTLMLAVILAFCAVSVAEAARSARLSVVPSTEPGKENVLVVSCLNGANETNSLWVAADSEDRGDTTNGWASVTRLATMKPSDTCEYTLPDGWGTDVKAIRFFLSEVPYDVDYTIEYFAADDPKVRRKEGAAKSQCIYIPDFKLNGDDRVETLVQLADTESSGNHTIFGTRGDNSTTPYIHLFWLRETSKFRYDYYPKSGTTAMNYSKTAYKDVQLKRYITASAEGFRIGDEWIPNTATPFTGPTAGGLQLLTGKLKSLNNVGRENMYYFRVFDKDGKPRLDLVPAVKGGRVCAYDRLTDTPYYSYRGTDAFIELGAGPRIEPEDPFFTSCRIDAPDSTDYTVPEGYVQDGGVRILAGQNDFGGSYTVSNQGVVVAAFGRGLGANDHLTLAANGAYGGWDGRMTATLGEGAGQVSCLTANDRLAFVAAEPRELVVNFGGAEPAQTVALNGAMNNFRFNSASAQGDVRVLNPFAVSGNPMSIQFGGRNVRLEGAVTGSTAATGGINLSVSTGSGAAEDATLTFCGTTNTFKSFQMYNGRCVWAPGTKFSLGGNAYVYGGTLAMTNAILDLTGKAGYAASLGAQPADSGGNNGGTIDIQGGEVTASVLNIGVEGAGKPQVSKVRIAGKVRLEPRGTGKGYIYISQTALSAALTLEEGADVQAVKVVHRRRNIYHYGGLLHLSASLSMAEFGTARYTLGDGGAGAVLRTPLIQRIGNNPAFFVFNGGKLVNTGTAESEFFADFASDSHVQINPAGGEFETDRDVTVSRKLGRYESSAAWNYASKDYLTAPAFRKSGSGTLTLTGGGTGDYRSATEVADGVLALAEGGVAALPEATVVRLSGGTLDLGGNAQTVKALCGTAGAVRNGTLTASEAIFPGGDGTVGSFTCAAALAGTLSIDVEADGSADQIVTTTPLDVSNLDLVVNLPDDVSQITKPLSLVKGPVTGTFKSVPTTLPKGWEVRCGASGVRLGRPAGVVLLVR